MGLVDDLKDKGQKAVNDVMKDPAKKEKIEQMARDKGISVEEAKAKFTKKDQS